MFAGAASLSDCNTPEDVNFRGVELLRTPSPAAWHKSQTPGSGASCLASASAETLVCDSQVGPGTPEMKVRATLSATRTSAVHGGQFWQQLLFNKFSNRMFSMLDC